MPRRLTRTELESAMADWPAEARELGHAARALVLDLGPDLDEKIAFGAPCYVRGGVPYGVIGGHVCSIGVRDGLFHLGFIHGAFLPDPQRLLVGKAKSKRELPIRDLADLQRPAVAELIRASIAFDPAA
jgi:hypothetical protein